MINSLNSTLKFDELTHTYDGNGIYTLSITATTIGEYSYTIQVFETSAYAELGNTPLLIKVTSDYAEAETSTVTGSGTTGIIVGREEFIALIVRD